MTLVTSRSCGGRGGPAALALAGTSAVAVSFGFARYGYGLFVPVFRTEFGLSPAAVGGVASAAYLAYLVAMVAAGGMTARWGPRLPVVVGGGCAAGGMLLVTAAHGPGLLVAGVVVAAASAGLCFAPLSDAVHARVRPGLRARVLAVVSTGTTFGLILAGPVALVAAGGDDWRWAWGAFAAAAAGSAALSALVLPGRPPDGQLSPSPAGSTERRRGPNRPLRWVARPGAAPLLGQFAIYGLVGAAFFTFAVDLVFRAGLPQTWRALLLTMVGLGGLAGLLTGDLVGRFGLPRCLAAGLVLLSGALAVLAAGAAAPAGAGIAGVVFGAAYMTLGAVLLLWTGEVYPDRPSSGFTVALCALAAGSVAGPTLHAAAAEAVGPTSAFLVLATIPLAGALLRPARTGPG